jgi:hypothetical protein
MPTKHPGALRGKGKHLISQRGQKLSLWYQGLQWRECSKGTNGFLLSSPHYSKGASQNKNKSKTKITSFHHSNTSFKKY